jgi:hypothetical protein
MGLGPERIPAEAAIAACAGFCEESVKTNG